jgi:hypothetical protein
MCRWREARPPTLLRSQQRQPQHHSNCGSASSTPARQQHQQRQQHHQHPPGNLALRCIKWPVQGCTVYVVPVHLCETACPSATSHTHPRPHRVRFNPSISHPLHGGRRGLGQEACASSCRVRERQRHRATYRRETDTRERAKESERGKDKECREKERHTQAYNIRATPLVGGQGIASRAAGMSGLLRHLHTLRLEARTTQSTPTTSTKHASIRVARPEPHAYGL